MSSVFFKALWWIIAIAACIVGLRLMSWADSGSRMIYPCEDVR